MPFNMNTKKPGGSTPAATIAAMEQELAHLRAEINACRDQLAALQRELAAMLAQQHGMTARRAPFVKTLEQAERAMQDAQEAASRHIGKPTETQFTEKLHAATLEKEQAARDLAEFERQHTATDRSQIESCRAELARTEESLRHKEQRAASLQAELDQAIEKERTASLVRLLSAFQDLYAILETDGATLRRMSMEDPAGYRHLLQEILLTPDDLGHCIAPHYTSGGQAGAGVADSGERPYLKSRQAALADRLAALRKRT